MTEKAFKTKIPSNLHTIIFEWYCNGMNRTGIMAKLKQEHQYHVNVRTLAKLLAYLKSEAQAQTQAVIAQQAQKQVLGDFDKLNKLYQDVERVAELAQFNDHNLYLRSVDRLVKLLEIRLKLSSNTSEKEVEDMEDARQEWLTKLNDLKKTKG